MLSGRVWKIALRSRAKSKSPTDATSLRRCYQATKSVDPRVHSQRSTAFPRSERRLKSSDGTDPLNGTKS